MKRIDAKQGKMFYVQALNDGDVLLAFEQGDEWLSRRQIAERLWRKVTPGLCERLERMVGQGKLEKRVLDLNNGQKMFWYRKSWKLEATA